MVVERDEDVQERIQTKKLVKRTPDKDNNEENKAAYKTAKKNVSIAKARAYDRLHTDMDTTGEKKKVLRMAKTTPKTCISQM